MAGFGKGINVTKVGAELKRITEEYGALTPTNVVNEARSRSSILHDFFEWNNDDAADQYRLQQARNLINNISVTVIQHGQAKSIGAFEIVSVGDGRSYKSVDVLTVDDIKQVRENTISDIEHLQNKLSYYNEFRPAITHLGRAASSLKRITTATNKKVATKKRKRQLVEA